MLRYSPEYMSTSKRDITLNFVKKAIESKNTLEGVVMSCDNNYTLSIKLSDNIVAKIPFSELEYSYSNKETKQAAATSKVGKLVRFIPKDIKEIGNNTFEVICSRKELQMECYDNKIKYLKPGEIIDVKVVTVVSYGAFCDIGCGIVALLPTNNISVTHIVDPLDTLKGITKLKAVVQTIDENYKIQLTHKELLGTWEEEVAKLNIGDILCGTVLSKESYGVFVRVSQNLSGLADIPNINLKPGDLVSFKVLGIIPDTMKVKIVILSLLDKYSEGGLNQNPANLDFHYVIDSGHIEKWVYSTPKAKKQIVSVF